MLDISRSTLNTKVRLNSIDKVTRRPRVLEYGDGEEAEIQRTLIMRAIALGLWHIDANGDVQDWSLKDPYRGQCPNLLQPRQSS